ncbi:MAG: tetratricopeptide repeat protein, partial [Flavobacteriales bacterium]
MLRKALSIFLVLLSISTFAQKAKFDSIVNLIDAHPEHDTTRVNWLMELQKYSVFDDAEDFLPYAEEAFMISKKIGYESGLGNSLNVIGIYYYQRGDYEVALDYLFRSIHVLDSVGLKSDLIFPYNNVAMVNNRLKHYAEAEKAYREILDLLDNQKGANPMHIAAVSNNLAVCLQTQEKFEESLEPISKIVAISTELGYGPGVALGEVNWSKSLNALERWSESLKHAQKSYEFALSAGMKNAKASAMRNLARAHSGLGNHKLAMAFADSSVEIFREIQQMGELFPSLYYQSEVYENAGKSNLALSVFKEFHELQDSVHSEETKKITESMRAKFETDEAVKDKQLAELEAQKAEAESARNRNLLIAAIAVAFLILIIGFLYVNRLQAQKKAQMLQVEGDLRESRMKAIRSQLNPHF